MRTSGARECRPEAVRLGLYAGGGLYAGVGFGLVLGFPQVWARFGFLPASILLHAGHGFGSSCLRLPFSFAPSHPPSWYSFQSRDFSVCARPLSAR